MFKILNKYPGSSNERPVWFYGRLQAAAVDVLPAEPRLVSVSRLAFDSVTVQPSGDGTRRNGA